MSLIARLMDNKIDNKNKRKEKHLVENDEKVAPKYEKGAYTNGIQGL